MFNYRRGPKSYVGVVELSVVLATGKAAKTFFADVRRKPSLTWRFHAAPDQMNLKIGALDNILPKYGIWTIKLSRAI